MSSMHWYDDLGFDKFTGEERPVCLCNEGYRGYWYYILSVRQPFQLHVMINSFPVRQSLLKALGFVY